MIIKSEKNDNYNVKNNQTAGELWFMRKILQDNINARNIW